MIKEKPIVGIFDSGVGGLSVLREVRRLLPAQPVIYFADQAHVPYGPRTLEEVRHFSDEITRYLIGRGARLVVVACNTASAAALHSLRQAYQSIPFVGMEPAVKPAAERTKSGVVGVLATPATFDGLLYASVVERFANGVEIMQNTCTGLVREIEAGHFSSPATRAILEDALKPMLESGIDTVVLGCTHYPFVIPLVEDIVGPGVHVIDPAPAVAEQVKRMLVTHEILCRAEEEGQVEFITTREPHVLSEFLGHALNLRDQIIQKIRWLDGKLVN